MSPTPLGPRHHTHPSISNAISVAQLVVLSIGVLTVVANLGKKDALLERMDKDMGELRSIAQELVKAQVLGAANDRSHEDALKQVSQRMDRLEGHK
jgi:hypothetical protein